MGSKTVHDPHRRPGLARKPVCTAVLMALALAGAGSTLQAGDRPALAGALGPDGLASGSPGLPGPLLERALADPALAGMVERWRQRAATRGTMPPAVTVENCNDSGPGSLREALASMTAPGIIDMTGLTCSRITLTSGALEVPDISGGNGVGARGDSGAAELALAGPGMDRLTIDGNHQSPVIISTPGGKYQNLYLADLSLANGRHVGSQVAAGGCVSIPSGALYLARTRVSDCVVDGGNLAFGGGILASTVMAKYSEVSNNTVIGKDQVRGGGINSKYQTIMVGSTITGNSVQMRSPEPQVERYMGGGGIVSKYQTVLALSTISGNSVQAESGNIGGGGVLSGEVVSYYSTFSGNSAVTLAGNSVGGAIRAVQDGNTGPVQRLLDRLPEFPELAGLVDLERFNSPEAQARRDRLRQSRVSGAAAGQGDGRGGMPGSAAIMLAHSLVTGNSADIGGGMGMIDPSGDPVGTMMVHHSTISTNSSEMALGGGLAVGNAMLEVISSTVAFNTGYGIWVDPGVGPSASPYLDYSILAGNGPLDLWVTDDVVVHGSYNLVRTWDEEMATLPPDTITGDPLLQPLAPNGSLSTWTHALGVGSPALDAGPLILGDGAGGSWPAARGGMIPTHDQRGMPFLRIYGPAQDLGAYEYNDILFYHGFQGLIYN